MLTISGIAAHIHSGERKEEGPTLFAKVQQKISDVSQKKKEALLSLIKNNKVSHVQHTSKPLDVNGIRETLQNEYQQKVTAYTNFYSNPKLIHRISEDISEEGSLRPSEKVRDARLAMTALEALEKIKYTDGSRIGSYAFHSSRLLRAFSSDAWPWDLGRDLGNAFEQGNEEDFTHVAASVKNRLQRVIDENTLDGLERLKEKHIALVTTKYTASLAVLEKDNGDFIA